MTFENNPVLRELLVRHDRALIAAMASYTLDDADFERVLGDVRQQHPDYSEVEAQSQAAFRLLTRAPARVRTAGGDTRSLGIPGGPGDGTAGAFREEIGKFAEAAGRLSGEIRLARWALGAIALLLLLLLLSALGLKATPRPNEGDGAQPGTAVPHNIAATHPKLLAQEIPGLIVQFQNAGATIGTYPAFLRINCSTNLTCTASGTTVTMTASSSAGSAFSGITTGTNTTATMTVGTGATLTFSGSGTINSSAINGVTVTGVPTAGQIPIAQSGATAIWADPVTTPKTSCGTTVFNLALQQVPTTNTVVTSTTTCLIALLLNNGNSVPVTVTVKDGQATPVPNFTTFTIQPNSGLVEPLFGISFTNGIQWVASATNVSGAVFGFQ